jgi:hypothetical protein
MGFESGSTERIVAKLSNLTIPRFRELALSKEDDRI